MKTKTILFFFLLLVVGAGKGFAQSANPDFLLQEIQEELSLVENWETVPGTPDQKVLAILTGKPVQVADSLVITKHRWLGFLYYSNTYYERYIYFDKKIKNFKIIAKKTNTEDSWSLPIIYSLVIIAILAIITKKLYWENRSIGMWIVWTITVGIYIFLSYYIGSIFAILSIIYIIKGYIDDYDDYKLKKTLENLTKE